MIKILHLEDRTTEEILADWRQLAEDGFQRASDDRVRELFAQVTMVLTNYQMEYSAALAKETTAKRTVEYVLKKLMNSAYVGGSVASRETKAKADGEYVEAYREWQNSERDRIIAEGYLNAIQAVSQQISRDINFRLKN